MVELKERYDVQIDLESPYMSRDELEIYDKYKNYSYIQFLLSIPLLVLGKMGLWTSRAVDKSKTAFWVQRKGRKVLFAFFLIFALICYQCHVIG
jgi:hypothetical protein